MSTPAQGGSYVGTASWHPNIELPVPGSSATAASVNLKALAFLQDDVLFLKQRADVVDSVGLQSSAGQAIFGHGVAVPSGGLIVGQSLVVGGDTSAHGSLFVDGMAAMNGLFFGQTGVFNGSLSAAGTISTTEALVGARGAIAGNLSVGGTIFGKQPTNIVSDTNQLIQRNQILIGTKIFSASNVTLTLDSSGEQDGDWLLLNAGSITAQIDVSTSSGTFSIHAGVTTSWQWLVRASGAWRIAANG